MRQIILCSHLDLITVDFELDIGLETRRGNLSLRTANLASLANFEESNSIY
jgi:hypothetical protein